MTEYDIFVPGRLGIIGEVSDLVTPYLEENNKLIPGCAIAMTVEQGIYATVKESSKLVITMNDKEFTCEMNEDILLKHAEDKNNFLEEVRDNPFSIILLDEIEKAHHDVINLFLQILDNGKIKSSDGNEVMFNNCIIIMTSNLGCSNRNVGFISENNGINNKLKEFFSIEFLNRIDEIITFNFLNKDNIKLIANNKLKLILKNVLLEQKIKLNAKKIISTVVNKCDYETYGARKIEKLLYDEINYLLFDCVEVGS